MALALALALAMALAMAMAMAMALAMALAMAMIRGATMKKFKEKYLELIWREVGSAKVRCGFSSIIGKDYEMFQSWQERLLKIEEEIIKFNETGVWVGVQR